MPREWEIYRWMAKNRRSEIRWPQKLPFKIHEGSIQGLSKYISFKAVETVCTVANDHIDIFIWSSIIPRASKNHHALKLVDRERSLLCMSNYSSCRPQNLWKRQGKCKWRTALFQMSIPYHPADWTWAPPLPGDYTIIWRPTTRWRRLLTGKYPWTERWNRSAHDQPKIRASSQIQAAATVNDGIASGSLTITELAFKWVLQHKVVKSMILGVSSMEQYETNMRICSEDPTLSPEVVEKCDAVYRRIPVSEIFSYLR